jgi:diadenosine tetraphosphate (Ap4A) HIT family hydrolase
VAEFALDPRIAATSHPLESLPLSELRLQDDGRFPWAVLIPRRAEAVELADLSRADQRVLLDEIAEAGRLVRAVGAAWHLPVEKLNIANLGNVTPQLHWHVVGRRAADPCWPGPVWGQGTAQPLSEAQVAAARAAWASLAP